MADDPVLPSSPLREEVVRQVFELDLHVGKREVSLRITPWLTIEPVLFPNPRFDDLVIRIVKSKKTEEEWTQELVCTVAEAIYEHFKTK